MKKFKSILCVLLTAVFVLQFAACKKNNKPEEKKETEPEEVTEETIDYTENWILSPSIQAQRIYSLPIVDFNETTNHYDVSFGQAYVIEKDGKYGLIDSNGKIVVSPDLDTLITCPCYEGYIATKKEGEYYTATYHIGSSFLKNWASEHTCDGFSGYKYIWDDDSSSTGSMYSSSVSSYSVNLKPYLPETVEIMSGGKTTGKFALANSGSLVSAKDFTAAGVFTGGIAAMQKNGKWGYIDSTGKEIIPFEYDAIEGYNALNGDSDTPFECSEGYVTVLKGGKYGIFTADGEMVIPCQYEYLTTVHDGRAYASKDGQSWGILCIDEKVSKGIEPDDEAEEETTTSAASTTTAYNSYTTASTTAYSYTTSTTTASTTTAASTTQSTSASQTSSDNQ